MLSIVENYLNNSNYLNLILKFIFQILTTLFIKLKQIVITGATISSTFVLVNSGGTILQTTTDDKVNVHITAGGQLFPYKTVGVYAGFRFLDMDTDNSQMFRGIGKPILGIDWWF